MISGWLLLLVSAGYVGLLFALAYWGDRRPLYPTRAWLRPLVYSLALAVYCSSWTFYGAVGTAARNGLGYLPIYLGPILVFLFAWRILERLVLIAREQNIVSIADFIAARYGRAQSLAALVAVIAVIAAVPYLALQFKAVAMSIDVLSGTAPAVAASRPALADPALYVAIMLAVFAILFGTRQIDATEHHHGMMLAVAVESLVKLLAFAAVGIFALLHLPAGDSLAGRLADAAATTRTDGLPQGFLAQTLLAFAAILCLPRQFHVAVVECEDVSDVRRARPLFIIYLAIICVMVIPVVALGEYWFGSDTNPDTFVLRVPLAGDAPGLALLAYVGGFSAATGMVIVASVALAIMVSNDLIMPLLWRVKALGLDRRGDVGRILLWVRRLVILLLALIAFSYYRVAGDTGNLAAFGLLAFAAVAQFAPAMIGGLYWRGASRRGAAMGLGAGFLVWIYTLLLPTLTRASGMDPTWLVEGPFGIRWLKPESLFALSGWDPITHGTFWSLLANIGAFLVISARVRPSFDDRLRAAPFLDPYAQRPAVSSSGWQGNVRVDDLLTLAGRIVGERPALRAFEEFVGESGRALDRHQLADRALVQFTERLLAASIGAASARLTLTTALRGSGMELGEVVAMLDETTQELRFNREVMSTTLDNLTQGISVVDRDLRLVAWNPRYQELFEYPDGMLYVGRPIADLIRYNAAHGECGPGDVETHVEKRLAYMRQGSTHVFERVRPTGQVIEMRGRPMPGGGFVTSFSDVTEYKRVERALREANENLEQRVTSRTEELAAALDAQRQAKLEAEGANVSKTRFLAAASHDLLQPLNAARLFTSALRDGASEDAPLLTARIDSSLRAAEELLDDLLDISRLDAGALQPELADVPLDELLRGLVEQYVPIAATRGLSLKLRAPRLAVRTDRRLLRRILQNFIANALRYTKQGRVLIGCRPRGNAIAIEVWDTGPGIPPEHMSRIFEEFQRLDHPSPWGEKGLGLGLSICQRISRMLMHPITVRSWPAQGSVFSVLVPRGTHALAARSEAPPAANPAYGSELAGLRVLCLDNDRDILDGMAALLQRWAVHTTLAHNAEDAIAVALRDPPDALLLDYHLGGTQHGLDVLDVLRAGLGRDIPAAVISADGTDPLKRDARMRHCPVLTKPVRPAALRAFLASVPRATARSAREAADAT